jgi:hypothetical protein
MDGWMDRWMDAWIDKWVGRWMDEEQKLISLHDVHGF